ncbi:MAG: zinc metallopeptidase, partial [Rhodoferax sp.]|nr:zinc metallopeptidase [Rhodoferax sp.]
VYDGRSISSIAVAAHEAGHSIQDADSYALLNLRSRLVPIASIGSRLWLVPFMIGIFMNASSPVMGAVLMKVGVVLFGMMVLFQLVTLPVEFDASNRAKELVLSYGIVSQNERQGMDRVLNAAALTYVGATAVAAAQLLQMVMLRGEE